MLYKMWKSKHIWLQEFVWNLQKKLTMIIKGGLHKIPEVRVPGDQLKSPLIYWIFASHSVCITVTWGTSRRVKFVDKVGSTIFNWNCDCIFAIGRTITKADHPVNFIIFHCRMSIIQPTWPVSTTSVCWHTRCWHFRSNSPHKTISSLWELAVTTLNRKVLRNLSFY